jgi:hypothetical protein
MKAVVVQIKGEYAALLQDDGIVVKKKNQNYSIGDVIIMKERSIRKKWKVAVAAAMFFMLTSVGALAYTTPYYYVSLDVNPSILMKVNMFERIIGAEAVNDDAQAIIEKLNLKNQGVENAICMTIEQLERAGYFNGEGGEIAIAASAKNNQNAMRLSQKLQGAIDEEIEDNDVNADADVRVVGYEMVQQAKELDITPGKLNIITNLLGEEVGDNVNESIKDLMSRYTDTKGNGNSDNKNSDNSNGDKTQSQDKTQDQTQDQLKTQTQDQTQLKEQECDEDCDQTQDKTQTQTNKPVDNSNQSNNNSNKNSD